MVLQRGKNKKKQYQNKFVLSVNVNNDNNMQFFLLIKNSFFFYFFSSSDNAFRIAYIHLRANSTEPYKGVDKEIDRTTRHYGIFSCCCL